MSFCQYDAYPTTWTEFLTAIQQDETCVHCPENGEWDINDYQPDGYTDTVFYIKCDRIEGNGTKIRNLKLTNSYFRSLSTSTTSKARIDEIGGLHFENVVCSNTLSGANACFMDLQLRPTTIDGESVSSTNTKLSGCTLSGIFQSSVQTFYLFGAVADTISCAINIEYSTSYINGWLNIGHRFDYANYKVATRGAKSITLGTSLGFGAYYSWFDLYGDDLTNLNITQGATASIFRCSAPITTVQKAAAGYPSIVSVPDPLTVVLPTDSNLIVCTDAQVRDANWLHDAGFPIAVDP